MHCWLLILYFQIPIILPIHIRIVPEFIWGAHQRGNFTSKCTIPCEWSEESEGIDGVLHFVRNDREVLRSIKYSQLSKINILSSIEDGHYYKLLRKEFESKYFTGTSMMDRKSDIPWPRALNFLEIQQFPQSPIAKNKAFFATRNCSPKNKRNYLIKSITKHIPVDSLSSCMNNGKWPKCGEVPCSKIAVTARYKLLLAFENGDSPGYVSEKIHDGYIAGVLPVYYGTSEVSDVVPRGSYIDVSDFDSFDEVGLYLKKVLENETLYNSYFDWKKQLLDPNFLSYMEPIWNTSVQCRMCKFVDAMKRGLEWDKINQDIIYRQRSSIRSISNSVIENKTVMPEVFGFLIILTLIVYLIIRNLQKLF